MPEAQYHSVLTRLVWYLLHLCSIPWLKPHSANYSRYMSRQPALLSHTVIRIHFPITMLYITHTCLLACLALGDPLHGEHKTSLLAHAPVTVSSTAHPFSFQLMSFKLMQLILDILDILRRFWTCSDGSWACLGRESHTGRDWSGAVATVGTSRN